MTLGTAISIVFVLVLIGELWLGIAVTGIHSADRFIEREKQPRQYWLTMAWHSIVTMGQLFVAAFFRIYSDIL